MMKSKHSLTPVVQNNWPQMLSPKETTAIQAVNPRGEFNLHSALLQAFWPWLPWHSLLSSFSFLLLGSRIFRLSVISSLYVIALPSCTRKSQNLLLLWTRRKDVCALCSLYHQAPVSHKHLPLQQTALSMILSYYPPFCYLLNSFLGWRRQQSKEEMKNAGRAWGGWERRKKRKESGVEAGKPRGNVYESSILKPSLCKLVANHK